MLLEAAPSRWCAPLPSKSSAHPEAQGASGQLSWGSTATSKADAFLGPSRLSEGVFATSTGPSQLCESTALCALGTSPADFDFPQCLRSKIIFVFVSPKKLFYVPTCKGLEALIIPKDVNDFKHHDPGKFEEEVHLTTKEPIFLKKASFPEFSWHQTDRKLNSHVPNYLTGILKIPAG